MPTLDARIDALYGLPLAEFTSARNALAKTLERADAALVKSLQKPTSVAWAVNLLYWRDRDAFERLRASGQALRTAQVAALEGRSTTPDAPAAAHRDALSHATRRATQLAAASGSAPSTDALMRMLEALSVRPDPLDTPGRWIDAVLPAGFEALAGLAPLAVLEAAPSGVAPRVPPAPVKSDAGQRRAVEAARQAAEATRADAQVVCDRADADVARADAWLDAARVALGRAEADAVRLRTVAERAREALARADAALAAASADLTTATPAATPRLPAKLRPRP